ncbi:MAG: immunoglobulin-like domain-containing protein, partial [Porticoccus sp.]
FDEEENPEFQDLLATLSAGEDISEDQDAPAAGESGPGGGEIAGGLVFSLIGDQVTPTAGIDPDYIPPPLPDPTADTDINLSDSVDLEASGIVTVNADAIPENEEIIYTAQVNEAPVGSDLILTLTNGVQITILEGQNSGTSAPQPAQGDDVYKDGETFNVGIQSSSGGGYDTLNIS